MKEYTHIISNNTKAGVLKSHNNLGIISKHCALNDDMKQVLH